MRTIKLPDDIPLTEIRAFADNLGLQVRRGDGGQLSLSRPQESAAVLPFRPARISPDYQPEPPRGVA